MSLVLEKIRSRGHWRINFRPSVYSAQKNSLTRCREAIGSNHVRVRGWDYPYYPLKNDNHQGTQPCGEYLEGWVDWQHHKEIWRMYRSRQFVHYSSLREDWYGESELVRDLAQTIKPGTVLNVVGSVVYTTAEIFEFLARLARSKFYTEDVLVRLTLEKMKGRELRIDDPRRMPLLTPRVTGAENIIIERTCSYEESVAGLQNVATSVSLEIFENFGWENPPVETIHADQAKLLSGRAD